MTEDLKSSSYPYGDTLTNESMWLNWDPKSDQQKKDGQKIHQAFQEWSNLVKQGAVAAGDKDRESFKRWFGVQDNHDEIKIVFANM